MNQYFERHLWSHLVIFSAMDESTQADQNTLVCQAMPVQLTFDSNVEFLLSEAPETDDYMRVQREA